MSCCPFLQSCLGLQVVVFISADSKNNQVPLIQMPLEFRIEFLLTHSCIFSHHAQAFSCMLAPWCTNMCFFLTFLTHSCICLHDHNHSAPCTFSHVQAYSAGSSRPPLFFICMDMYSVDTVPSGRWWCSTEQTPGLPVFISSSADNSTTRSTPNVHVLSS